MAKGSGKKVPASKIDAGNPKKRVPSQAAQPIGFAAQANDLFRVRCNRFDFYGPWCLSSSPADQIVTLMTRIRDMEHMFPSQVFSGDPGKDYGDPSRLPNRAARDRLTELRLMDETNVSRLRISGAARLYGFRRDPEFYAIFWDPKHEIWS